MAGKLFAYLIFGLIGMAALAYGKKQHSPKKMLIGAALMVYPYVVADTLALWGVGAGLTAALFMLPD